MVERSDCISKSDKTAQTERQGQSQGSGGVTLEGQSHREKLGRANQEHGGKPIRIFLEKTLIEQLRWNKSTWYTYGERIEDRREGWGVGMGVGGVEGWGPCGTME